MRIYTVKLFLFLLFLLSSDLLSQIYIYPDSSYKWIAGTKYYPNRDVFFRTYLDDSLNTALSQKINAASSKIQFELGARDEIILMFINYKRSNGNNSRDIQQMILPVNLHLTAGLRFYEHYKIDFRIGFMFVYEDYTGVDGGIFLQSDLFNSNFYAAAGIDYFNNGGTAHGTAIYSESGGTITSLCFGLGYTSAKKFNIDAMYYFPLNKKFGYNYDVLNHIQSDKINNGLLVMGFQYSFTF